MIPRGCNWLAVLFIFGATPCFAQSKGTAPIKGFVCASILSNAKLLLPTVEEQKKETAHTVRMLKSYLTHTLRQSLATPATRNLKLSGSAAKLNEFSQSKLAQQLAGVVRDLEQKDGDQDLLKVGLTLKGKDSIEKFFGQLEASTQTFHEMVAQDDLNPDRFIDGVFSNFILLVGAFILSNNTDAFIYNLYHQHFASIPQNLFSIWVGLSFLALDMNKTENDFYSFLSNAKQSLDAAAQEAKVFYFSKRYKILPATFNESWTQGSLTAQSLIREMDSNHLHPPIKNPFFYFLKIINPKLKPKLSYVRVDYFIDASGRDENDFNLYVVIRAKKAEVNHPKPKLPARIKEKLNTVTETARSIFVPAPVALPR